MVTEEEVKYWQEQQRNKTPEEIIQERIKMESDRQTQKEINFWKEVGKHVKIHTDISEVEPFEPSKDAQILEKFSDIKIGFKRG